MYLRRYNTLLGLGVNVRRFFLFCILLAIKNVLMKGIKASKQAKIKIFLKLRNLVTAFLKGILLLT